MVYLRNLLASIAIIFATTAAAQDFTGLIPSDRLLGRDSAGDGQVEPITVNGLISFTGSGGITLTEDTIEAAIDTLANLTSVQGLTVTLADAGADAVLGWDETASAYENLTAGEVLAVIEATTPLLTEAEAAAAYQPLDADLTSWAGVTRASGFDTFAATPSYANLAALMTDESFVLNNGETVTFTTDPGADAFFGFDDTADAYEALTAGEAIDILETADGSGSGLDADTLDGVSSAGFLQDFNFTDDAATAGLAITEAETMTFAGDTAGIDTAGSGNTLTISFDVTEAEANIESAIDTLANLTSIQSLTVTLADAGADAVFGWDESASAYENLTAGEVLAVIEATTPLLTEAEAAAAYQPLDGDLTSWAGVTRASGFDTFAATPSSANLDSLVTDDTGSGALVFGTSPTLATATIELGADLDANGNNIDDGGVIFLIEQADADADVAGSGQIWVDTATPNVLMFTDDAGTDFIVSLGLNLPTEASPAAGDFLYLIDAAGVQRKVDWDDLPGAGGGISNVVEDTTPQLGGDLDLNNFTLVDDTLTPSPIVGIESRTFYIQETDAGATGAGIDLWHNSSSPADGDIPGRIQVAAGADDEIVGSIRMELDDGTSGSEDTQWQFVTRVAGADLTALTLGNIPTFGIPGVNFDLGPGANPTFAMYSNSAGSAGPALAWIHDSSSPADSDIIAAFTSWGRNDAAELLYYGYVNLYAEDVSDGTEDSRWEFGIKTAGADLTALTLGATTAAIGSFDAHIFRLPATNYPIFEVITANAAEGGPNIITVHDSATPASGDFIGNVGHYARDSAANLDYYGGYDVEVTDATSTSEDSRMHFYVKSGGADLTALTLGEAFVHTFRHASSATNSSNSARLNMTHNTSGTAAAGFGSRIVLTNENDSGSDVNSLQLINSWTNAAAGSEASQLRIQLKNSGSDFDALTLGTTGPSIGTPSHLFTLPSSTDFPTVEITSAVSGAGGPYLILHQNSGTPADNDIIGGIHFRGENDASENIPYVIFDGFATDVTDGTEDGQLQIKLLSGGSSLTALTLGNNGLVVESGVGENTFEISGAADVAFKALASGGETSYFGAEAGSAFYLFTDAYQMRVDDGVIIGSGTTFPGAGWLQTADATGIKFGDQGELFYSVASDGFYLESDDTGTSGARLYLWNKSASPSTSDEPAIIALAGYDAGLNYTEWGTLKADVDDLTDTSEDSHIELEWLRAGASVNYSLSGSIAKFWVRWTGNSTTILDDENVDSIADTAVGDADITITTDFANANWSGHVTTLETGTDGWDADSIQSSGYNAIAAGTAGVLAGVMIDGGTAVGNLTDPDSWSAVGFGN